MKKVLLLSCLISMPVLAGTGGGTSTPPAKAGLQKLLVQAMGLVDGGEGFLRSTSSEPLPTEIEVVADSTETRSIDRTTTVEIRDQAGMSRVYLVTDGDELYHLILKDRREIARSCVRNSKR